MSTENGKSWLENVLMGEFNRESDRVGQAERDYEKAREELEAMHNNGVPLKEPLNLGIGDLEQQQEALRDYKSFADELEGLDQQHNVPDLQAPETVADGSRPFSRADIDRMKKELETYDPHHAPPPPPGGQEMDNDRYERLSQDINSMEDRLGSLRGKGTQDFNEVANGGSGPDVGGDGEFER